MIERLVHAATEATPLRPHEVAAIVERAEGNPLFVEEVTRLALGSGSLGQLPESVHAAMSTQIDQLHPPARRVLRYCAVLGRSFRREVLERILTTDDLALDAATLSALSTFIEADGEGRVRFRNSLVRDAAYEGLAFRVRARIHRMAGSVLEDVSTDLDGDSATLVLHFARAGDAPRTWDYAQMAGELARRSYANADAADHFETALEAEPAAPDVTDEERARLWMSVGDLRELAGMFHESVEAYRTAARLTRADPVATAEVLSRQAAAHLRTGAFSTTLRVITRARRLLVGREDDRRLAAPGSTSTTSLRWSVSSRSAPATPGLGAQRHGRGEGTLRARGAWSGRSCSWTRRPAAGRARPRGATPRGPRHLHRARAAPEGVDGPVNLGAFAYYAGRWVEAAEWYRSSRRWRWRRAAPSWQRRLTSTSPSCSSTRAISTRRRTCWSVPCACCGLRGPWCS